MPALDEDEKRLEEEKEKEKEKAERGKGWWSQTPTWLKISAIAILFLVVNQSASKGEESLNKIVLVAGGLLAALYLFSKDKMDSTSMLTPEQAERIVREEIKRKIKEGQFPKDMVHTVGPNIGLKSNDGIGQYYIIQVQMVHQGYPIYKRAIVGVHNGICTIQDNVGIVTGREAVPTIKVGEKWMKQMQEYGFDSLLRR